MASPRIAGDCTSIMNLIFAGSAHVFQEQYCYLAHKPKTASGCDFNRSLQHLTSNQRKERVVDEEVP